ncbi:MAG: WYL domain-containing protein [Ruminococcus sp.]|nr:WYL domain-containing protein [Ruminococcus sp.]
MTIFHEIYSNYFRIASEILSLPEITEKHINEVIRKYGFRDTLLFLPQRFISQDNDGWGLLKKVNDRFFPVIKNKPVSVLTEVQKQWLKSKLDDPKINLFMNSEIISALQKRLENVRPLYRNEHFRYTDRFSDGDDFSDNEYQKNFRIVLNAVKNHEILEITFSSKNNRIISGCYVPVRIQYSPKNNRFRIFVFKTDESRLSGSGIINIGRIRKIRPTGNICSEDISIEKYFSHRECRKSVTVCISTSSNANERFFMEFAPYEKRTEIDLSSGKCAVTLWYDKQEETELLIHLLGFGSVVEIISPQEFRQKAKDRIFRQYTFLYENRRS